MLQKFCAYNNWANSLLLDSLAEVFTIRAVIVPNHCMTLLSHIANAQVIWTCRMLGSIPGVSVWQLHDLDTCSTLLGKSAKELAEIVKDRTLHDHIVKYNVSTGEPFATAVADILLHLFNHGTYHRSQIAKEMRAQGLDPINTDYIRFVR